MIRLAYSPDFVEEAVLTAEATSSIARRRAFRRERDRIYEIADPEQREASFRALHLRWFVRLALHDIVEGVVAERADIAVQMSEGRVVRSFTRSEEGAELIDRIVPRSAEARPLMVLRLRPAMLLEPDALCALLRHELAHIGDMLDPAFGYERTLPPSDDGPSGDNIVRDRYRVLWDVTIDGRLARAGHGSEGVRAARRREFAAAFSMLGDRRGAAFDDWFDRIRPTHAALAAFAQAPNGAIGVNQAGSREIPSLR